MHKYEHLNFSR